jgi:hypothetical protein
MSASSVPQNYPLAIRDSGLAASVGLVMKTLPYAVIRFAFLMGFAIGSIVWLCVTIGGSVWLGTHIAQAFGWIWFIGCVVVAGWVWATLLRYALHLIECGHVAVLTELITRGGVANGAESMFAYGRRIVTRRFGEVNILFAMNALVRGILNAFHRTLDWIAAAMPIPGLSSVANLVTAVLRAATRYMDKVIFSYNLARDDPNPWESARDGVVYYCQNAEPILKTSIWIVIVEFGLSAVLWLLLLAPAAAVTVMLPHSVREIGGLVTIVIAVLFAWAIRGAFIKPIFLVMIMVRFHTLIEHQPINAEWVARLDQLSVKFRDLGQKAQAYVAGTAPKLP